MSRTLDVPTDRERACSRFIGARFNTLSRHDSLLFDLSNFYRDLGRGGILLDFARSVRPRFRVDCQPVVIGATGDGEDQRYDEEGLRRCHY
jgi:hypothetical protein